MKVEDASPLVLVVGVGMFLLRIPRCDRYRRLHRRRMNLGIERAQPLFMLQPDCMQSSIVVVLYLTKLGGDDRVELDGLQCGNQ